MYAKHLSLPEVVLQRGLSNWGDTGRMRAMFHKLREGVHHTSSLLLLRPGYLIST